MLGTGTLARNPEIKWKLEPDDFPDLQQRQLAILRNALEYLAPGGRVVYSTCSLEPEENENVVGAALAETPEWQVISGGAILAPHLRDAATTEKFFSADGFFRTFPPEHGTDGFFAAIFARREKAV